MAFLGVGFLLPTEWQARAHLTVVGSPEEVFVHLDSPEGWRGWTTWPDGGLNRAGPERGAGASLSWDDPDVGRGSFAVVVSDPPRRLEYQVEFGPSMEARGSLSLTVDETETLVEWEESGHLGNNPLMGYWALFMEDGQREEMRKGLERLAELVAAARDLGPSERGPRW